MPYIEDMPVALASADFAISRAGAMSLAELCAWGVPSILVPLPTAAANHQYHNAVALAEAGAAVMVEEKELGGGRLWREMMTLVDDAARRAAPGGHGEGARPAGRRGPDRPRAGAAGPVSDAFAHLPPEDARRAEDLAETFRALGAEEPEAWALSEVEDGHPAAGALHLSPPPVARRWTSGRSRPTRGSPSASPSRRRTTRRRMRTRLESDAGEADEDADAEPAFLAAQQAVQRILAAGADPEDLKEVARAVFLHAAFDAVSTVDEGHDPQAGEGMPGWLLTEVGGDLTLTGRMLDELHEDLLTTEP